MTGSLAVSKLQDLSSCSRLQVPVPGSRSCARLFKVQVSSFGLGFVRVVSGFVAGKEEGYGGEGREGEEERCFGVCFRICSCVFFVFQGLFKWLFET